ncbi:hypothetical protein Droror1_Dr00004672 [Drosera rotundifolia]
MEPNHLEINGEEAIVRYEQRSKAILHRLYGRHHPISYRRRSVRELHESVTDLRRAGDKPYPEVVLTADRHVLPNSNRTPQLRIVLLHIVLDRHPVRLNRHPPIPNLAVESVKELGDISVNRTSAWCMPSPIVAAEIIFPPPHARSPLGVIAVAGSGSRGAVYHGDHKRRGRLEAVVARGHCQDTPTTSLGDSTIP